MVTSSRRTRRGVVLDNANTVTINYYDSDDGVDDDPRSLRRKSGRRRFGSILERANAEKDPPELSHFSRMPSNSSSRLSSKLINNVIQVRHYTSQLLPTEIFRQCFDLFAKNMSDMYAASHWGLDLHEKEAEMRHENARFLVALSSLSSLSSMSSSTDSRAGENDASSSAAAVYAPQPLATTTIAPSMPSSDTSDKYSNETLVVLGFIHYRYECDNDNRTSHPITYLYELQVHQSHQKLGLGSKLVSLLENISRRLRMKKVMLTVFRVNVNAILFYDRIGYAVDKCSPSNFALKRGEVNDCDYEILSKVL